MVRSEGEIAQVSPAPRGATGLPADQITCWHRPKNTRKKDRLMTLPAPRQVTTVTGWQGVPLHVPEWGDPDGLPIVLIHGWSQAHPCWQKQVCADLDGLRVIAPDLRGHGLSGKPEDSASYDNGTPWAEDLNAILADLDLHNAVLVGWSMGGWVVQDYLRAFGDKRVSGYCLVGSSSKTGNCIAPEAKAKRGAPDIRAAGMCEGTLSDNLAATVAFVRACFYQQPDSDSFAQIVGYNMLCPQAVRRVSRFRHEDYAADLAGLTAPALVLWGQHERLAVDPMPQDTIAALPNARGLRYDQSGHSPFWEEADRFNADLAAFARDCNMSHAERGA